MSNSRFRNSNPEPQRPQENRDRTRGPQNISGERSGQDKDRELEDRREGFRPQEYSYENRGEQNRYRGPAGNSRNNYIPGVHEESDFSFGSEYIRDERAYRPSRMSRQTGSRSWIGVGESSVSGDQGGRLYSSSEYSENPSYVEDVPGHEYDASQRDDSWFGRPGSRRTQSFAGRGPQGYKRSDERITEEVNERLTQDHDVDASRITVECKEGEIVLKGFVTDRDSKRRAEEIAESCFGVTDVQNQLRIQREDTLGFAG